MAGLADDISNGEIMVIVVGIAIIGYILYRAASTITSTVTAIPQAVSQGIQTVKQDVCSLLTTNVQETQTYCPYLVGTSIP